MWARAGLPRLLRCGHDVELPVVAVHAVRNADPPPSRRRGRPLRAQGARPDGLPRRGGRHVPRAARVAALARHAFERRAQQPRASPAPTDPDVRRAARRRRGRPGARRVRHDRRAPLDARGRHHVAGGPRGRSRRGVSQGRDLRRDARTRRVGARVARAVPRAARDAPHPRRAGARGRRRPARRDAPHGAARHARQPLRGRLASADASALPARRPSGGAARVPPLQGGALA